MPQRNHCENVNDSFPNGGKTEVEWGSPSRQNSFPMITFPPFPTMRVSRSFDRQHFACLVVLCVSTVFTEPSLCGEPVNIPDKIEFNRDIRPILSDKCFACHGPDKSKREADLRLDTDSGLHGTADAPGVVIPSNVKDSKLLARINTSDPAERMPPAEFGKEITDSERALIQRWIEQGAKWQGHWAFQPLQQPTLSDVDLDRFSHSPIDRFVYQSMSREGLAPSQPESPRTLVRRLSFDMLGLPPSPEVVERFAANPSPQAYEKMVDELLASPHFGERMAVWWLDLVRYADSVGYHGDQPVKVSPFRDYVIRSFNENKRFDQFTIEQLAGDLLPEPTTEHLIASGYNRLGMMSAEGGAQAKEYLSKYASERVRNLSGAWLGVTIGCSECHDHKYDPFTTREFYQLESFFADIQEQGVYDAGRKNEPWGPEIQVPTEAQKQRQQQLGEQIAAVRKLLDTPTDALVAAQNQWESQQVTWSPVKPANITSLHGVKFQTLDDSSILASGESPATDTYELLIDDAPANLSGIRLEVLPHDSLPNKGPGRAGNGNFVLSEFEVYWRPKSTDASSEAPEQSLAIQRASATYEQVGAAGGNPYGKWAIAGAIDRDEKGPTWGWAVMEQAGRANAGLFELAEASRTKEPGRLRIVLKQNLDNPQHTLGHFRLSLSTEAKLSDALLAIPADIEAIRVIDPKDRNEEQRNKIAAHFRSIAKELEPHRAELDRLQKSIEQLNAEIPTTLVTKRVEPRVIRILGRGNWMDESGEVVQPGFPSILGPSPQSETRRDRLDLAKWVVSKDNPLTARTAANRIWKLFYGAGLSRKLDDLGAQGEWPSHPELLDWLATHFIESGWDVKQLVKSIVMSETYRQSSAVNEQVAERDPYNRWLSHQGRWRLDAEFVRDNALAVSGLLRDSVGGDSVRPYQPARYWAYLNFPAREWQNSVGEQLYRRSLYTHWQRQYLHPSLMAFDAPGREECVADRTRSNTPLQALVLLNDPIYVEASRVFAARILAREGSSDEQKIAWAINQCTGRPARDREIAILNDLLTKHRTDLAADAAAVDSLLSVGEAPLPANVNKLELAAWTSIARALFNLHESIARN